MKPAACNRSQIRLAVCRCLRGERLILAQNQFNLRSIRAQFLREARLALPVARRFTVVEDLLECLPVHSSLPENLPLANALH